MILQGVSAATAAGERPVVLLDLDSTLIHTGARHLAILRAFAKDHPELQGAARALRPGDFGWGVDGPLRAQGVSDEALLEALLAFWRTRFFTSELCAVDEAAPGAVGFVSAVVARGGLPLYLTARPAPTMAEGTRRSLARLGFPPGELHMKPSERLTDEAYKRDVVRTLVEEARQVIATFDNEPAHCHTFLKAFPEAVHVLYGHVRSPRAPAPSPELIALDGFHV